jgi:hypothetical protein
LNKNSPFQEIGKLKNGTVKTHDFFLPLKNPKIMLNCKAQALTAVGTLPTNWSKTLKKTFFLGRL